jgi:microcystin-dependent protein
MSLETATYIGELVATNPPASDPLAQASNHICLIKSTLQNTFPKINSAVSVTAENLNNGTPVGLIAMWSGATIPAGWTLCNGVAVVPMSGVGTITPPDLRDRFIVGSGLDYTTGNTGGLATNSLSIAQLPSHVHGVNDSGHSHGVNDPQHSHGVNDPQHSHGVQVGGTSNSTPGFSVPGGVNGNYLQSQKSATGISIAASGTGVSIQGAGTGISIQATGSGAAVENRPPYYALAFIMKI